MYKTITFALALVVTAPMNLMAEGSDSEGLGFRSAGSTSTDRGDRSGSNVIDDTKTDRRPTYGAGSTDDSARGSYNYNSDNRGSRTLNRDSDETNSNTTTGNATGAKGSSLRNSGVSRGIVNSDSTTSRSSAGTRSSSTGNSRGGM